MLIILGGTLLFIIPGIIFSLWFMFAPYRVILSENKEKTKEVFSYSKKLVIGRWWAAFWRVTAPQAFFSLVLYIIIVGIAGIASAGQLGIDAIFANTYFNILLVVASSIVTPLLQYPTILLYRNLEETKEA